MAVFCNICNISSLPFFSIPEMDRRIAVDALEGLREMLDGGEPDALRDLGHAEVGGLQHFQRAGDAAGQHILVQRLPDVLLHHAVDVVGMIVEVPADRLIGEVARKVLADVLGHALDKAGRRFARAERQLARDGEEHFLHQRGQHQLAVGARVGIFVGHGLEDALQ